MRHILVTSLFLMISIRAAAQSATLKINSDLIIHPSQISNVLAISSEQINSAGSWTWPELTFQTPYKTKWSQVQAKGPFVFKLASDLPQEVVFEFDWAEPSLTVGEFAIKDTMIKDMGGFQAVINLDGSCSGMKWKVLNGNWKVSGRVAWSIINQQLQVQWKEFNFSGNAAAEVAAELGECQGPPEITAALKESAARAASDQNLMQDILRRGILSYMNNALGNLRNELMRVRTGAVNPQGLDMTWEPQFMINMPGGLIRIPGYVWLKKQNANMMPAIVDRTLPEQEFSTITESGFVLPKDTLEAVALFAHEGGDLRRRFKSTEIQGFNDLIKNWFSKSFVWPDLNKFSWNSLFYFDLYTSSAPQLSNVRKGSSQNGGGLIYDAKGSIGINTLAPTQTQYLPYVDFRSSVTGIFRAAIRSQQLLMGVTTDSVPLTATFRPEYQTYRDVNTRIDTGRLGKAGTDFINGKTFTAKLPSWNLGPAMKLVYGDLKLFKQSVVLPLSFQKK